LTSFSRGGLLDGERFFDRFFAVLAEEDIFDAGFRQDFGDLEESYIVQ
jgi:hypothetical protein